MFLSKSMISCSRIFLSKVIFALVFSRSFLSYLLKFGQISFRFCLWLVWKVETCLTSNWMHKLIWSQCILANGKIINLRLNGKYLFISIPNLNYYWTNSDLKFWTVKSIRDMISVCSQVFLQITIVREGLGTLITRT